MNLTLLHVLHQFNQAVWRQFLFTSHQYINMMANEH